MFTLKIVAVIFLTFITAIDCSGVVAPVHAGPALRYSLVAPQNIRPFAAQVSTFTRGLSVYDAPYAAGVLNVPAIVNRAVVPGIPPVPAPLFSAIPAPAPVLPAAAPVVSAVAPAPVPFAAAAPAPWLHAAGPAPWLHAAGSAPLVPAPAPLVSAPAPWLFGPEARSVHAVSPGLVPPFAHALHAAPLLR